MKLAAARKGEHKRKGDAYRIQYMRVSFMYIIRVAVQQWTMNDDLVYIAYPGSPQSQKATFWYLVLMIYYSYNII